MQNVMVNSFIELSDTEMNQIDGGGWDDIFEKMNPMEAAKFVYQMGQDFGASSVTFGREFYKFYKNVKEIFG